MFRKRTGPTVALRAQTVAEAAAIVEGKVRGAFGEGDHVPRWAWINELAHASWSDLRRLAETSTCAKAWEGALSYLANEMCVEARSADGLLAMQRSRLIPLELSVLAGRTGLPATPSALVAAVELALGRIRPRPRATPHGDGHPGCD